MAAAKIITLLRTNNLLVVDPTTPAVFNALSPALHFASRRMLYGDKAYKKQSNIEIEEYDLYTLDHRQRLTTTFGFYSKVCGIISACGYTPVLRELTLHPNPAVLEPWWDRLFEPFRKIELRHRQDEMLVEMAALIKNRQHGRFDCPPGYGKSFLIGLLGVLYPKAKIHVVSDRVPVVRDRIFPELCQMLPDVGIVGGGRKKTGCRVMCYTVDSLNHSDGDCDILIADECHELASDCSAEKLARYVRSTNIGLSATHDMRLDNKNLRVEAMFGPVVFKMGYAEAAEHGMVVPIEIRWSDVIIDTNPCSFCRNAVERKRLGIWQNEIRNQIIARDAESYPDDVQRLITCETIEHALFLKKILPDYTLVYSEVGIKPDDIRYYQRLGVWPEGLPMMTRERRSTVTKKFETGVLKKVIATTVWNVGVSFNHLEVLLRADAGGSPTMDTQIPGRTSRLNQIHGKSYGIVHDYSDQFDFGFMQRAKKRQRSYAAQQWLQVFPVGSSINSSVPAQYRLYME